MKCDNCGKQIKKVPSEIYKHNFCNRKCKSEWQGGKTLVKCDNCGKNIKKYLSHVHNHNFCNRKCKGEWCSENMIGKNSPGFIHGNSKDKYCYLFSSNFKRKIRNKNNYKCFLCGKLEEENKEAHCVHHVNYDKNCMCGSSCDFVILCRSCHSKTNGKYKNRKYWEDVIINHLYPNKYFMTDI